MSQETSNRSFDELTRGLASGSISRGRALRLMGAAVVGGALASVGIGEADADDRCKPTGKKCKKNAQCCSGNCSGGTCAACASGQVLCDSGSCASNSCPTGTGQSFNTSTCQCECPTGKVKLSNGTCATPCTTAPECPCGKCRGSATNPVQGYCATDSPSGSCTSDADCDTGQFCGRSLVSFGPACLPTC